MGRKWREPGQGGLGVLASNVHSVDSVSTQVLRAGSWKVVVPHCGESLRPGADDETEVGLPLLESICARAPRHLLTQFAE